MTARNTNFAVAVVTWCTPIKLAATLLRYQNGWYFLIDCRRIWTSIIELAERPYANQIQKSPNQGPGSICLSLVAACRLRIASLRAATHVMKVRPLVRRAIGTDASEPEPKSIDLLFGNPGCLCIKSMRHAHRERQMEPGPWFGLFWIWLGLLDSCWEGMGYRR